MLIVSPEKVATPPDACTESVPPRVASPGLLARATVTVPLNELMRLPELFSASTVRPKGLPAVTLDGCCCVTTSWDVVRVATPIAVVPGSVNQTLPSGPVVIPPAISGKLLPLGRGKLGDRGNARQQATIFQPFEPELSPGPVAGETG